VTRRWTPDPSLPASPGLSLPFDYEAYVPDEIADIDPVLPASASRALQEADEAVRELNDDLPSVTGLEALARQLLRQESVASSRIEGLVMSHRRLARAAIAEDDQRRDANAESILGNIAAMEHTIRVTAALHELTPAAIVDVHRVLMRDTRDAHIAGVVRTSQNWIGGSNYSPRGAAFVPPPVSEVERLLADLAAFLNRRDLSPTLQAAIAHAQFETIHPFNDGNGRAGRALVHVMLRSGGATTRTTVPVSAGLLSDTDGYYDALTAYRGGDPNPIIEEFSRAAFAAVENGRQLATDLRALHDGWASKLRARKDAVAWRVLPFLLRQPSVTSKLVQETFGVTQPAADNALRQLQEAGALVRPKTVQGEGQKRNVIWQATEVLDALDRFAVRARRAPRTG